jgi:glycosyltransferase involved in cell wall biosynthesis
MPRIQIEHIDAAAGLQPLLRIEAETMLVFWRGDRPVGQVIDQGSPGTLIDLARHWAQLAAAAPDAGASNPAESPSADATTSLVICTRDRPNELIRCLASLEQQTQAPGEVIVVDNASRDGRTRAAAEAAGVIYIREDRPGLDIARNAGVRAARGDIIAFTDDDVRLHPSWFERLTGALADGTAMAATGLVLPAELETEAQQIFERHWGFGRGYDPQMFGAEFFAADLKTGSEVWQIGAGASMAFRREAFDLAGLFDERLDVGAAGCSGDSELWHRILSKGGVCRYEPAAVAFHYHRRDLAGLSSQIYHYMKGHSAALLVQYERSRNRGNLWRAFNFLPRYYVGRSWKRLRYGTRPENRFLGREIAGFIAGIAYYLRRARSSRG